MSTHATTASQREAPPAAAPPARTRSRYQARLNRSAYRMLAPGLLIFAVFFLLPIAYTLFLSFQRIERKGLGLGKGGSMSSSRASRTTSGCWRTRSSWQVRAER